ncbi:transcriptional activator ARO80 [Plectosphaerella cucumerina]|uniref:Transcriptional activator ARO80 n=1 Tax=Plectosphaerella cucumerina TaxID=40658 RepID=A0A8K0TNV9_9PEZI|nr:transcriptional activator ARO80 [Plectosphaerella cucumerina]
MASYAASGPSASPAASSTSAAPGSVSQAGQQQQQQGGGGGAPAPDAGQHKRVYQACIPCRRRKVRCDLGSVDNPHDPPCVRCRRESKECFFSATRRKRKNEDGTDIIEADADEYIVRNGRKRVNTNASPPPVDRRMFSETPLTPGGGPGRDKPLPRPDASRNGLPRTDDFGGAEEPNTQLENREAQSVLRQSVFGTHDALDLLYKAATNTHTTSPAQKRHESAASLASLQQQPAVVTPASTIKPSHSLPPPSLHRPDHQPVDPGLASRNMASEPGYADAIKAWGRFRFVRAGWFSAQEAIEYIDYYYEYLSPLTPISPPTFRNPASHLTLLTEEPILTVTLLTIASRYRKMPGTGGHCRSHAIHEQLWTYLRGMVERCLWGQEAFGGGFAAQASNMPTSLEDQNSTTAPWRGMRKGSLRTLGTIESLMILTEWHPRALHFPPSEAIDELMLPSYDGSDLISTDENGNQRPSASIGGRRIESWLEPAWRSDRMCWMLLSTAMGLAYELGVFDDIEELLRNGAISRPEFEDEYYRHRAARIKRLLLIYLTQLAGRLGWTNMVPEVLRKSDPAVSRKKTTTAVVEGGTTPGTNPSSLSNAFNYIPDLELDDQIIHCWAGISNVMHLGNEKLFRNRKHTADIIQSGKYTELLQEFRPLLNDWFKEFERFRLPPFIRHILTIEYEYVRIYVNSLSLQAVVERSANHAGSTVLHAGQGGSFIASAAQLSPQTQNYFGKLPLGQLGGFGATDQEYIKDVVDGCRKLLRTVVEGLLPGDYLKHAPVRTYFRIISGAMFLLKTFALGAPRSDVKKSIDLMDLTVEALRNCVVDDVHLGIRFADLLESLTSRLRNRFIQAPALGQSGDGRSPDPHGVTNGGPGAANGHGHGQHPTDQTWSSHANRLRDGLNAQLNDPTANISARPFDLSTGNFPYPSGTASALNPSTPAPPIDQGVDGIFDSSDWANPNNEMWYLPPGPAFFQNMENGGIAMTAEGLNVGGVDLLEYMAMDQPFAMDGGAYQ